MQTLPLGWDHHSVHLQSSQFSVFTLTPAQPLRHQAPGIHNVYVAWPIICHSCMKLGSFLSWVHSSWRCWDTPIEKCRIMRHGRLQLTQKLAIFPHLTYHLKLFQYLGFRAEPRGLSNFLPFFYLFICSIVHASICWGPLLNNFGGRHYQMWLSYCITKKPEFIFLIIFVAICLFLQSEQQLSMVFFCVRGDGGMRKLISFKASCGKLQWKILPSEEYSAAYRTQVWSVHSSILFIPA